MKIQKFYWLMLVYPLVFLLVLVLKAVSGTFASLLVISAWITSYIAFGYFVHEQLRSKIEKRGARLLLTILISFLIYATVVWVMIKTLSPDYVDLISHFKNSLVVDLSFISVYMENNVPIEAMITRLYGQFGPYLGMSGLIILVNSKNRSKESLVPQAASENHNTTTTATTATTATTTQERPSFCPNCGAKVETSGEYCSSCGGRLGGSVQTAVNQVNSTKSGDGNSVGMNVLSFLFPIIGLILYLVWQNDYPIKAKNVGKWALIGFIIGLIGGVIYYFSMMSLLSSLYY